MSEFLSLFVHHPLRLLALAGLFVVLWAVLRRGGSQAIARRNALLAPVAFFVAFAAWEWLVMTRTPEANIRVDLLMIWPAALVIVVWSIVWTLRR